MQSPVVPSTVQGILYLLPPVSVDLHRVRNLDESGNVRTSKQTGGYVGTGGSVVGPLGSGVEADLVACLHDVLELAVDLLGRPLETLAVLGHLETRDGDTTDVGCLCKGRSRS